MTETSASAPQVPPQSTISMTGCATELLSAADALHAELLAQCDRLMGACEGTKAAAKLERIAPIVEAYEQARWPIA